MKVTESQLISFITSELGLTSGALTLNSRLKQDLGLMPEDAMDLIKQLSVEYDVDIESFRFNDYYIPAQGLNVVLSYILSIFGNSKPVKSLKVSDILNVLNSSS